MSPSGTATLIRLSDPPPQHTSWPTLAYGVGQTHAGVRPLRGARYNARRLLAGDVSRCGNTPIFRCLFWGLRDARQLRPFSCSAAPLTAPAAPAPLSHRVALADVLFQCGGLVYMYFLASLPGALQSAQTSVLCSFLDISKAAEI